MSDQLYVVITLPSLESIPHEKKKSILEQIILNLYVTKFIWYLKKLKIPSRGKIRQAFSRAALYNRNILGVKMYDNTVREEQKRDRELATDTILENSTIDDWTALFRSGVDLETMLKIIHTHTGIDKFTIEAKIKKKSSNPSKKNSKNSL